jgi:hypothetical protein
MPNNMTDEDNKYKLIGSKNPLDLTDIDIAKSRLIEGFEKQSIMKILNSEGATLKAIIEGGNCEVNRCDKCEAFDEIKKLKALLKELEWSDYRHSKNNYECFFCGYVKVAGHSKDCKLSKD